MKKEINSVLYQRFLDALADGKEAYFDADEVDELMSELEEASNFTYYEDILELGLKLHPDNLDLQVRKCHILVWNQTYDQALELIDSLSETDHEELDMLRMECYAYLKRYDDLFGYLDLLIEKKVDYLERIFESISPMLGNWDKRAFSYMEIGLELFPDNQFINEDFCYNLENKGQDTERAIKICNKLIDLDPYEYDYWFMLGRLYSVSLQYEKAIEAFDFALACNPSSSPEVRLLKGYCLYMNENYEKAIEVYSELLKEGEVNERIFPFLGDCYIKIEKYEDAYVMLKKIIGKKSYDDDPSVFINMIRCCLETDRKNEAEILLKKANKLFPDNTQILSLQAFQYMKNGEDELAVNTTGKVLDLLNDRIGLDKESSQTLYDTAQTLYLNGEAEKALKYYLQILKAEPNMPYLHLNIALAYLFLGDMEQFHKHYKSISEEEIISFLNQQKYDVTFNRIKLSEYAFSKKIPSDQLILEYLNNKNNYN